MKSPCGSQHRFTALLLSAPGSAPLAGNLCPEPPTPAPAGGDRQQLRCQPLRQHGPKPSASPSPCSCPAQRAAESGMADNKTPVTGFPLLHQHGFTRGAAARRCWEGRPQPGRGLRGRWPPRPAWCRCSGREMVSAALAVTAEPASG